MPYKLDEFDYSLPGHCIAQFPLPNRSASRLLVMTADTLQDRHFNELPQLLGPNDLLVLNDSRVIHARLFGCKESGGRVEVLIERQTGAHEALAMIRASKSPATGSRLRLADAFDVTVLGREGQFYRLSFPEDEALLTLIERHGSLPLPPYIRRELARDDENRYQTIFAQSPGSVAAPTAGLHFDEALLLRLQAQQVRTATLTLHVGAGTFQPVHVSDLSQHHMHRERFFLSANTVAAIARTREAGGRVIAVGTTTLRALEAAAQEGPLRAGEGETSLFILPGFHFRVVDALLTNFHLPKSTLLMLVSAFAGTQVIRCAYAHAITRGYRFFSYGDAMFITSRNDEI